MHQIQTAIAELQAALKDATDANPVFLPTCEKAEALVELGRIEARVHELWLRVLAVSQDVAEEIGAKDPGSWLVGQTVMDGGTARKELRLAQALEHRHVVRAALAEGRFSTEHAWIITKTLDDLPADLSMEVVAKAEAHLCELATQHRPGDLRKLCKHLHEVIDPETAEAEEAKALARLEAAAEAKATLSITPLGDGMTKIYALVPEAVGERLRTLVEAYAQPRITALEADGKIRPRCRIMADALGQLLECVDSDRLPAHGGDSTTLIVTVPLEQLQKDLSIAAMADGTTLTAAETRRLACTSGIIPAVLGGKSEPLDLGRTRRLFSPGQRKALKLRDGRCRAEGCTVPATWCDAHHHNPWSKGGKTDLADGILLCGHHHRRAHDPTYTTTRLATTATTAGPSGRWDPCRAAGPARLRPAPRTHTRRTSGRPALTPPSSAPR